MSAQQLQLPGALSADAWAGELARALAAVPEVLAVAVLPGALPCAYVLVPRGTPVVVHDKVSRAGVKADRAKPVGAVLRVGAHPPDGARVVWRRP